MTDEATNTEAPAAPPAGDNLAVLRGDISRAAQEYESLREKRAAIGAEINKLKAGMEEKGIPRRVFERCFQDWLSAKTEDGQIKVKEQRTAETICREALGLAQMDLFDEDPTGAETAQAAE